MGRGASAPSVGPAVAIVIVVPMVHVGPELAWRGVEERVGRGFDRVGRSGGGVGQRLSSGCEQDDVSSQEKSEEGDETDTRVCKYA